MAQESNTSISYLLSLKQSTSKQSTSPEFSAASGEAVSTTQSSTIASAGPSYAGSEKRRSTRYKCEGSAELRENGSEIKTWATFTDISMHGCYVEATTTYPVGTFLVMKLDAGGSQVFTDGNVRVNYPGLGMGIAFTGVTEESRMQLRELLKALPRPTVSVHGNTDPAKAAAPSARVTSVPDPAAAIRTLIEYFEGRQILMRDEFIRLLRKSQTKDATR